MEKLLRDHSICDMRSALEVHRDDLSRVKETYDLLSNHYFTHATPNLFNSSLKKNQLSSCMLLNNQDDSIEGIYQTFKECSILGAASSGIGLSMTNIRANGSVIKSTGRKSEGIPRFLMIYDANAGVISQGGKRKMSTAIYIEPWHSDFVDVIEMRANDNVSPLRARELFYAVWSNNLLYERARDNLDWSFFCPTKAPMLCNTHGEDFKKQYLEYEHQKLYSHQMPARELYKKIAMLMLETGGPYNLNKDACIAKSNMKHTGILNSSNLCAEILIPSGQIDGQEEIGVCTLASINLTKFVVGTTYDFEQLANIAGILCNNLNNVIDNQFYPLEECKRSSMRRRPIGIGVQGLQMYL